MKQYTFLLIILILTACSNRIIKTKSGLEYKILTKGKGMKARAGDDVFIFETTSYRNGSVLYSNYNSKNAVKVLIGGNQATDAVDEGLRGMRAGEIRELYAPHYLVKRKGYPENVSPDSPLVIRMKLDRIVRN